MQETISILVTGKVQGVFYRQSAKEKADELGIKGKIMNLPGGKVQLIATGTRDQLELLLEWCKQGPPKADVTRVDHQQVPLQEFNHFTIVRF